LNDPSRPEGGPSLRLPLRHAAILGLVQGPTELLPVSSSAHTTLIPWLAGWPCADLDPELRNSLEVALHAGTAAALLIVMRAELAQALRELDGRRLTAGALALAPTALVGYLLERRPERRPRSPRALAAGLALGAAAMALADTRPRARPGARAVAGGQDARGQEEVNPRDGLLLGLAQALALAPGVSRNGATLAAARARGFAREDAQTLSWRAGLPVILGAAVLKSRRLSQRGVPPGMGPVLATGAGAAFLSTLASASLIQPGRRGRRLLPFSLYRLGLALLGARKPRP
jgi:undecaprenyl-diphosphatase